MKVKDSKSSWVFITPIYNLELTDAVTNEIQVRRVTFISSEKLIRIRNRLGIKKVHINSISEKLKKVNITGLDNYFKKYKSFAILRKSGVPKKIKASCFRIIQEELMILAFSQLYYQNRRFTGFLGLAGEHDFSAVNHLFLDSSSSSFIKGSRLLRSFSPLTLDKEWLDYHKKLYFFKLLKLFNGKNSVSPKWKNEILRATILIGKSINSSNIAHSFLWNIIALELLLTQQGDSYSIVLPKRIETLIGWHADWDPKDDKEKITRLYKLRCQYVHDGNSENITKQDLLSTDTLVFNILGNIVGHLKTFGSKNELIAFAEHSEARRLLGLKQKIHPKLFFVKKSYTKADIEDV